MVNRIANGSSAEEASRWVDVLRSIADNATAPRAAVAVAIQYIEFQQRRLRERRLTRR